MPAQRRFTVRTLSALRICIAALATLYLIIAYAGGHTERREYFPFFNWSLFSSVDSEPGLVELHVKRIGDRTFDPPVNFFELGSYFATARIRSTDLVKDLTRLYGASQRGDLELAEKLRKLIEFQHLSGHGVVEYQLVFVEFRPVERWKSGRNLRERVLGEYRTGDGK